MRHFMKIIALIATSLALLGANAFAHDAPTSTKTVKVTNGSVVTLYSIPSDELTAKGGYTASTSKSVSYNDKKGRA